MYLKLTHRPIEQSVKGKSTPEAFLGKAVAEFGAERIAVGLEFPGRQAAAAGTDRHGPQGAFLPAATGSRSNLLQDRAALYPALAAYEPGPLPARDRCTQSMQAGFRSGFAASRAPE